MEITHESEFAMAEVIENWRLEYMGFKGVNFELSANNQLEQLFGAEITLHVLGLTHLSILARGVRRACIDGAEDA